MGIWEIIITIAIFIAVAASQKVKKNKTQQPPQTPVDINDTEPISSNTSNSSTFNTPDYTITMTGVPHTQQKPAKRTKAKKQGVSTQVATAPKTPNNTPKTDSIETDEDLFDLRKAVIYSEILTPKFKEDEY